MHGAFQISPRKGDKLLLFIIIEKPVLVVLLHLLALLFIFIFFLISTSVLVETEKIDVKSIP